MVHLVYCDNKEKELEKILNKNKTMIIRGAAGRKIPHSRVFNGEEIYFIEKGTGLITAKAIVKDVQNFVKLSDEEIKDIIEKINPMKLDHQSNMDDWLIINKIEDVAQGTSVKYNYDNIKMNSINYKK